MEWERALRKLQDDMATVDLHTRRASPSSIEFLVKQYQDVKLRMDGNHNHRRPHLHIDYGKEHHAASYAIDNGMRLAGKLNRKYDRDVQTWIGIHRDPLLEAWRIAQSGQKPETIIAELKGSAFP